MQTIYYIFENLFKELVKKCQAYYEMLGIVGITGITGFCQGFFEL